MLTSIKEEKLMKCYKLYLNLNRKPIIFPFKTANNIVLDICLSILF